MHSLQRYTGTVVLARLIGEESKPLRPGPISEPPHDVREGLCDLLIAWLSPRSEELAIMASPNEKENNADVYMKNRTDWVLAYADDKSRHA
jgi:hypothetical protein